METSYHTHFIWILADGKNNWICTFDVCIVVSRKRRISSESPGSKKVSELSENGNRSFSEFSSKAKGSAKKAGRVHTTKNEFNQLSIKFPRIYVLDMTAK